MEPRPHTAGTVCLHLWAGISVLCWASFERTEQGLLGKVARNVTVNNAASLWVGLEDHLTTLFPHLIFGKINCTLLENSIS